MSDKFKGHTPGPWSIDWNVSRLDVFSADGTVLIATLRRSSLSSNIDAAAKANARLIAAAPDMHAELTRLLAENEALKNEMYSQADVLRDVADERDRLRAEVDALREFAQSLLDAYHSDDGMPEAKHIAREARAALKGTQR